MPPLYEFGRGAGRRNTRPGHTVQSGQVRLAELLREGLVRDPLAPDSRSRSGSLLLSRCERAIRKAMQSLSALQGRAPPPSRRGRPALESPSAFTIEAVSLRPCADAYVDPRARRGSPSTDAPLARSNAPTELDMKSLPSQPSRSGWPRCGPGRAATGSTGAGTTTSEHGSGRTRWCAASIRSPRYGSCGDPFVSFAWRRARCASSGLDAGSAGSTSCTQMTSLRAPQHTPRPRRDVDTWAQGERRVLRVLKTAADG